jgi:ribosome-associated translation inhibitor RaiA
MQVFVDSFRVEITTKECEIPPDERARLQSALTSLGNSVKGFANPSLVVRVVYHPRSEVYHAEFKLKLPGRSLLTAEEDPYLDTALSRCVAKLTRKVEAYKEHPDAHAVAEAERRAALDENVVAPEDPDAGPLAEAVNAGDYRKFRTALAGYEEWLRKRVGRLVQRHPEAQARVGNELLLGDVIEEVYLNAFERFTRRPTDVRLSEWLEGLIEPSIHALVQHPEEEATAASLARTVREGPLEKDLATSAGRPKGGQ